MKVLGVITEYNPFHQGHLHHLEESRRLTGADYAVAVMSGDFVQRGAPAILDKRSRAEMALRSGADLVLELPVSSAAGSAEAFAEGAVSVLDGLGAVTDLSFGSEYGGEGPFTALAKILAREPDAYRELLQKALREGISFPAARARALEGFFRLYPEQAPLPPEELRAFLESPNNILGLEYCKALVRLGSSIRPRTISRQGEGYHSAALAEYASATGVRRELLQEKPDWIILSAVLPRESYRILQEAYGRHMPVTEDDFSLLLKYRLMLEDEDSLQRFLDVTPDLARRLKNRENSFSSWSSFAELLKTKEVTYTRICRVLTHILLDLRKQPPASCARAPGMRTQPPVFYARVLGMRREAAPLLAAIAEKGRLPLITRPAQEVPSLSPEGQAAFARDVFASNLYESVRCSKFGLPFVHEYQKPPVIL